MTCKWVTDDVKFLLMGLTGVDQIDIEPPGGDHDTEVLVVRVAGGDGALWIRGFNVEVQSQAMVEMVEVQDGLDSRGGLNSHDMTVCEVYGRVCATLRQAGFTVVSSMNDYF